MAILKNSRHEKFVQCLIQGMSQRKAYREAFPNSQKWKDATVDKRASELKQNGEVLGRYEELQKVAEDDTIMNAKERKKWLTKKVLDSREKTENQLKALDILNKMDGEYTNKVEVSGLETEKSKLDDLIKQMRGGG